MRKIKLLAALLLFPALLAAQEHVTVKGRVVNEQGEGIEYVQLGVPRFQIGSISGADGRFEIKVPRDTLVFFHVSYQQGMYPVTGPADDVVVVLREQELPPAMSIGGRTKEKYLLRPGTMIFKDTGVISTWLSEKSPHSSGREVGSVARATKPFLVQDITLTVHSNKIPGCVGSINIYRINGKKGPFVNVLHRPIYFAVAESDKPQHYDIQPSGPILLEPGRYFIAFQLVDGEVSQTGDLSIEFNIYLKKSFLRDVALGELEAFPVNIGIAVKGLEYQ